MVFANYDKWRYHSIFRITGIKDLKHVFPGFGIASCLFVGYLGYKNFIQQNNSHGHHEEDHHHVIIKGASHARELNENEEHGHGHH